MFLQPDNPVYNSVILYILIITMILVIKPSFMYDYDNHTFKLFGLGDNKTIYAYPVVTIGSAVLLYIFFLLISIVSKYFS
jgi:hypothetical protein